MNPAVDYTDRVQRAQAHLAATGTAVLLASLGSDLPYLTGYEAMPLERLTLLVAPAQAEPTLLVPELEAPRVAATGDFELLPWSETEDPIALAAGLVGGARRAMIGDTTWSVFLLGLLWKRANGAAALTVLCTGFLLGAVRFVAEVGKNLGWFTWQPLIDFATINFLHFAILLFAISIVLLVAVSLATSRPTEKNMSIFLTKSVGVTGQAAVTSGRSGLNVVLSVLLVLTVLIFWVYFSGWFFGGTTS